MKLEKIAIPALAAVVAFIWWKQSQQQSTPVAAYLGNDGGVNFKGTTISVTSSLGNGPNVTTSYIPDSL